MNKKRWNSTGKSLPISLLLVGAAVGASVVLILFNMMRPSASSMEIAQIMTGPIKYNCEQSNGTFENGTCSCPLEIELGQTQDIMFDSATGFCQTTSGGPGGVAAAASMGVPYGDYSFWNDIIFGLCERSGGSISGAACICPARKIYNKSNGQCI